MNGPLFRRYLNPLDLLELLNAALHLLGFCGLIAKTIDKDFQLLDALALVAISPFELLASLRLLRQILVVIPRIKVHSLVPDLDNFIDRHIQEIAIV